MDHLNNIFGKSNLLDLSKKIFNIVLNEDIFSEEYEVKLNSEILKAETINFVLADGLGTENLKISRSDFLNNTNSFSVNSTFPSSTNVALSTINYVSKPVDTAILGYYLFDRNEHGLINALNWNQDNKSILKDIDLLTDVVHHFGSVLGINSAPCWPKVRSKWGGAAPHFFKLFWRS